MAARKTAVLPAALWVRSLTSWQYIVLYYRMHWVVTLIVALVVLCIVGLAKLMKAGA
jgi:hypothetical protein